MAKTLDQEIQDWIVGECPCYSDERKEKIAQAVKAVAAALEGLSRKEILAVKRIVKGLTYTCLLFKANEIRSQEVQK